MSRRGGGDSGERRLANLQREYGPFDVVEQETVVPRDVYTDCLQAAEAGSLGGARVFLFADDHVLLVRYRDQSDTWDLPGGPTKRGESFGDTAELRVFEDVGVSVSVTGIDRVLEQTFALVDEGDGVDGYWVFFEGETAHMDVEPGKNTLDAQWFGVEDPPRQIGPHVEARLTGD